MVGQAAVHVEGHIAGDLAGDGLLTLDEAELPRFVGLLRHLDPIAVAGRQLGGECIAAIRLNGQRLLGLVVQYQRCPGINGQVQPADVHTDGKAVILLIRWVTG